MTGFKIPLDAWVVSVPMAYAAAALTGLMYKIMTTDPDLTNAKYYEDEAASTARGEAWNSPLFAGSLMRDRVKEHKTGVFQNWFEGTRQ